MHQSKRNSHSIIFQLFILFTSRVICLFDLEVGHVLKTSLLIIYGRELERRDVIIFLSDTSIVVALIILLSLKHTVEFTYFLGLTYKNADVPDDA